MAGKHQKAVTKAAAKGRTQKTVYRLERVYDSSTGVYTFQTVSHRVDKDYGKRKKSKGKKVGGFIVSKGKKAIQTAWRSSGQIQAGNGGIQDSASDAAKAGFETTKKGIKAAGVLKEGNFKYNKKRVVKLQNKADFSGFQLEGRKDFEKEFANKVKEGKISQNSVRRAMQKEVIKKKYQSQAVLKYAQQKSKAAFVTSSAARKKMIEQAKAATKKYLIIGGAVVLLLCALLGGCAIIGTSLFGGGSVASLGVYLADKEELEQAEYYFNCLEMLLAEAICDFEEGIYGYYATTKGAVNGKWTGSDGMEYYIIVEYDPDAIRHDPSVLINYLTIMYGDFKINMGDLDADPIANEIQALFFSCYGLHVPAATDGGWGGLADDEINGFSYDDILSLCEIYTTGPQTYYTPRKDAGGHQMYDEEGTPLMDEHQYMQYHYKIGGSHAFRSLEDVVQERVNGFGTELQSRYELISRTNGALQQARNIMGEDIDIHERVVSYYGNCLTNTDYSYDGWRPPNGQSWAQASRDYVSLRCDSGGNYIYAGMDGTVSAVGSGTVTIKNANSGIFSANYITFENLNTVNVTQNQIVTPNTVIGSCNTQLYIYYKDEDMLGSKYRNPLFYIN